MLIVNDPSGDYHDGPTVKINLTRFSDPNSRTVLFYGYNSLTNRNLHEQYKNYDKKILLNLWMPTEFSANKIAPTAYQPDGKLYDYFDEVWTICPYTIDWLRQELKTYKYRFIYHPFASPEDYGGEPLSYDKAIDICYFGGIHGPLHVKMAQVISKYNHRISYVYPMQYITDVNITHHQKLQLAAASKITILYNHCAEKPQSVQNIISYHNWQNNKAFEGLSFDNPYMCQFKCRAFEALYCKNMLLVHRDRWNIIEQFLHKDRFIYFDDHVDLENKINYILSNYHRYNHILDDNFKYSYNFNGKATFEFIKRGYSWRSVNA